jgi:hypothetical protein
LCAVVLSFLWLLTSFLLLSAFPLIHRFHHHLLSLFPRRDVKGRTWRHPTPLTTSLFFFSSTHDFSSSALLPFLRVCPWFKRTRLSLSLSLLFLSFSFLSQGLFF